MISRKQGPTGLSHLLMSIHPYSVRWPDTENQCIVKKYQKASARPWRSETRLTQSKTPSRRHLLAAATIGLAPITLALWLTYPGSRPESGSAPQQANARSEKATGVVKSAPSRKALVVSSGS